MGEPAHIHDCSVTWKRVPGDENQHPLPRAAQFCSQLPPHALQRPEQSHKMDKQETKTQKVGESVIQNAEKDVCTMHTEKGTSWACDVIFVL